MAAAGDGAVVLIHGNDRHILVPVDLRGKALTLRAAPASRPILQLAPSTPHGLSGPLLFTDRSLTLDGIDLQCLPDDGLAASTRPAQLVAGDGAPLSLLKCRLHVAHGSAAIVCRNCPTIMLHDCSLHADGLGLCVEVGGDGDCAIDLARSDFRMKDPGAAALSVWAPELRQSANVRLRMEGNAFEAGRVAAFASLSAALEIDARGNQFHFQQALLSFAGVCNADDWRRMTTWHGRDNRYAGPASWLQVNGTAIAVHDLSRWRSFWGTAESGSLFASPAPRIRAAALASPE